MSDEIRVMRTPCTEVMLTTEERMVAMETLVRLDQQYPGRIQAGAPPFPNGGHLFHVFRGSWHGQRG